MIDLKTSCVSLYILFFAVWFVFSPVPVSAQAPAAVQQLRDGQHDFDFHFGTWHTHIRLLDHPLIGSNTWVESDGTVTVRKIWDGRASLEELEGGNSTIPFKGMTLLLYNPPGTSVEPSVRRYKCWHLEHTAHRRVQKRSWRILRSGEIQQQNHPRPLRLVRHHRRLLSRRAILL